MKVDTLSTETTQEIGTFVMDFDAIYVYPLSDFLGCRFPVNSADFWLCLRKFCGEADRGRLAGQWREFKTHRKSTAQIMKRRQKEHKNQERDAIFF